MSWFDPTLFAKVFVTLVVIMDPLGNIPVFLALLEGRSAAFQRRAAWQGVLVSLCVVAVFAVFGQHILDYLGISVPALQGAGGLLLLLIALELLTGRGRDPERVEEVNVALVPLGTPMLAGPGTIVAIIVFVKSVHSGRDVLALAAAVVCVHLVLWLALRFSLVLIRVLGETGIHFMSRISGLLLSAIAVQLVAESAIGFAAKA